MPSSPARPFETRKAQRERRNDLRSNHWRRNVRPQVLARDNYICHICGKPIDPNIKSPHPMSASVDHTHGAGTGYDMRYLKAAHRGCNMERGDPLMRRNDPEPKVMTQW